MRFSHLCCIVVLFRTIASQTCSNFEVGINRPGPWYAFVQTTDSIEACCALCNAEGSRCQSWLFVRPGSSMSPGCYLKQNIPLIEETSSCGQFCTGGVKSTSMVATGRCIYPGGAFELAIDRPGSTYVRLPSVVNHSICCTYCQLEGDKCRSWTFIRAGAPGKESGCALKNQVAAISSSPCVACVSGTK